MILSFENYSVLKETAMPSVTTTLGRNPHPIDFICASRMDSRKSCGT
jgi:hypothetical protein